MSGVFFRIKSHLPGGIGMSLSLFLLLGMFFSCTVRAVTETVQLKNLRTEMLTDPDGIGSVNPRLSWELAGDQRGIEQTAYQVMVASTPQKLANDEGDLWNSGKVESDQSIHVVYQGEPLGSRTKCYWKVKVWSKNGESAWSEPAYWSMGLMNYKDWSGRWIGLDRSFDWESEEKYSRLAARYFRKEFKAEKEIKSASAYIIGLGLYELYLNGEKVGDQVLAPGPTDYVKNVKYNAFDVTEHLKQGDNAIGVVLGNGRYFSMRLYKPYKVRHYGYPKMLFQLEVEYSDGSKQILKTDESWKVTADGPIRTNNEYDGEEYDARKEMPGWNKTGFDDSKWLPVEYVHAPGGEYEAQMNENMKVMKTLKPVSINQVRPGTFILDMGQNMVGWVKMKVRGSRGDKVTLRFAEILDEKGELAVANLRDARATDVYTLKGGEEEIWEPSFVYHGFQFVEVTGYPGTPRVDDFEGRVVYDGMETTGSFETSNRIINQVFENAWWGIAGNYKGMPVDCPQRNERQPWMGDRTMSAYGESFLFDNAKHYAKWLDDIMYSQKADGSIPDVAPAFWNYYSDNMTWPGTYLMVAEMLYRQYGDARSVNKHYPHMKKWLEYMRDRYMTPEYIVTKDSYGDWCAPPATIEEGRGRSANVKYPSKLISTAYYYHFMQMMQRFAEITGNQADIPGYQEIAEKVKNGFNKEFFNADSAFYGDNTLTDNLLPLAFRMAPEDRHDEVFENVVRIIEVENNGHLSSGVVGMQWLMRVLTDNGRPDLAFKLATSTTYPSWGYMVENGATTIWELWNGNTAAPNMNSYNHVMMLGDLLIWYYENVAGIRSSPDHPGFRKIEMKPEIPDGLDFVKASYRTPYGPVVSEWQKESGKFKWNISVPGNAKAIVYLPARSKNDVKESGEVVSSAKGVKFLEMKGDRAVLEVGSGEYALESVL